MPLTKPRSSTICEYPLVTASRRSEETVEVSTASGSTTSTGSASNGRSPVRSTLK